MKKKNIKKLEKSFKMTSQELTNFFYLFFVVLSLIYAGLLFSLGQKIEKESVIPMANNIPNRFEGRVHKMVEGHPIDKMVPYIARKDKKVAGYLVAIAKKESNWGKFSPKKEGRECYNYWGYRGSYNRTASGYSCFDSPRQAVDVVGKRIQELIEKDLDTPQKIVVWKCGWNCSGHSSWGVSKWIDDVDYYYDKVENL